MKNRLKQKLITVFKTRWILQSIVITGLIFYPLFSDITSLKAQTTVSQQLIKVKGTVVDKDQAPLIGVTVALQNNTSIGTMTDIDGTFTLDVPANSKLTFTYVGHTSTTIDVNGRKDIHVVMQENVELLDEIVVVGYGVQKKASITGAVSAIQGKELVSVKTPNVSNMLAGKLPGLRAVQQIGRAHV